MSARRKHVRAHVHDLDVEIHEKEGDVVCRVEDVKGGNVIEVTKPSGERAMVRIPSRFANIYFVRRGCFILCTGFVGFAQKTEEEEEEGKEEEEEREMRKRQQQELVASTSTDLSVGRTRTTKRVSSSGNGLGGKVTGELKRVLTREQIKSVKRRALWPEIFAEDDTEYTNKISEDVRRTISPDDLLKIEEKLRIENGGKKSKRKEKRKGGENGWSAAATPLVAGTAVAENNTLIIGQENREEEEEEKESSSSSSLPPLHKNTNFRRNHHASFADESGENSSSDTSSEFSSSS
ncbi:unnamed protein product [Bathycoccus prasinos]